MDKRITTAQLKQPGYFASIWEKGTRLFVDDSRLDEARAITERVLNAGTD